MIIVEVYHIRNLIVYFFGFLLKYIKSMSHFIV